MINHFDCYKTGNMDEYVERELERYYDNMIFKFTQPVLLKTFQDKFDLTLGKAPKTPAPV